MVWGRERQHGQELSGRLTDSKLVKAGGLYGASVCTWLRLQGCCGLGGSSEPWCRVAGWLLLLVHITAGRTWRHRPERAVKQAYGLC